MSYQNYKKIHDSLNKSNPDRAKSFATWQRHVKYAHQAILPELEKNAEAKAKLPETYVQKEVIARSKEIDEKYQKLVDMAKKDLVAELDALIVDKMAQYQKIALSAPSEEQLRLLQVLSMRDPETLSEGELIEIATSMKNNVQSMKVVASIARRAGLQFPAGFANFDGFKENIANAEDFCLEMLESLGKPDKDMTYRERAFFTEKEGTGISKAYFRSLDEPLFAATQNEPEPEPVEGTEKAEMSAGERADRALAAVDKLVEFATQGE